MIDSQGASYSVAITPTAATNGATITSQLIDTLGIDYLSIPVFATTADVVSNKPTVLQLSESDDTVVTNQVAIVAFTGGTATSTSVGFVIPSAQTATGNQAYVVFDVDCRARKRYLQLKISPQTTQTYAAVAQGTRREQIAVNATTKNCAVNPIG